VVSVSLGSFTWQDDVANFGRFVEMELGAAGFELTQNSAEARLDGRIVGAIAGYEFFDDGAERRGRQMCVENMHAFMVQQKALAEVADLSEEAGQSQFAPEAAR
jgi:hypothetical protein